MLLDEDTFYKDLGERVKTERLKAKLSQEQLAQHLGLTRTSVVNFEGGRHRPSVYQLIQIGNFLSVNFTQLIPYSFEQEQKSVLIIDMDKVVSDQGDLNAPAKMAVANFLTDLNKDKL